MICTEQIILILLLCVAVECCLSGHVNMARCIRLLCAAPKCNISIWNAIWPFVRELISIPVFFMLIIHTGQIIYTVLDFSEISVVFGSPFIGFIVQHSITEYRKQHIRLLFILSGFRYW